MKKGGTGTRFWDSAGPWDRQSALSVSKIIANKLMDGFHTLSEALAVVKSETDRLMKALKEEGIEK